MFGPFTSSGLHDTIRTNGTPAVVSAGNATTLSSTITSGRTRSMISSSCGWQNLAPSISSCQTGFTQVSSCSMVGLRNCGAVSRIEAARRAMLRHGTHGVLLNQVAEQAGLTSGAVLYHYPSLADPPPGGQQARHGGAFL